MDEKIQEQTEQTSQATEVVEQKEGEQGKVENLGKFKDVASLLNAYNSLEAEFTKRCQKIKELESNIKVDKDTAPTKQVEETKGITQEEKDEILKGYLKSILNTKQQAIILDKVGVGIKAPISKPKTIAEAGQLAQDLLNKNN